MRACLVAGRVVVFEDESADRVRDLDLLVFREAERVAALGFDLGLVMEDPLGERDAIRRTTSAPPEQTTRQGMTLKGPSAPP